jgi:hypothetical protein
MPIVVHADARRQVLFADAFAAVTLSDLVEFFDTARRGERGDWPMLFDLGSASIDIGMRQIQAVAKLLMAVRSNRSSGPRAPVAIVAASVGLFGIARTYQSLCEAQGIHVIRVFRSRTDAHAWISATHPELEP